MSDRPSHHNLRQRDRPQIPQQRSPPNSTTAIALTIPNSDRSHHSTKKRSPLQPKIPTISDRIQLLWCSTLAWDGDT
ncbi:MAG: hypothetical protein AAGD25_05090 [Cyanobacteria bacterium P01_F01_bin.150]